MQLRFCNEDECWDIQMCCEPRKPGHCVPMCGKGLAIDFLFLFFVIFINQFDPSPLHALHSVTNLEPDRSSQT